MCFPLWYGKPALNSIPVLCGIPVWYGVLIPFPAVRFGHCHSTCKPGGMHTLCHRSSSNVHYAGLAVQPSMLI